jgi:hypothetical protein
MPCWSPVLRAVSGGGRQVVTFRASGRSHRNRNTFENVENDAFGMLDALRAGPL